jgi:hypothetical protein
MIHSNDRKNHVHVAGPDGRITLAVVHKGKDGQFALTHPLKPGWRLATESEVAAATSAEDARAAEESDAAEVAHEMGRKAAEQRDADDITNGLKGHYTGK